MGCNIRLKVLARIKGTNVDFSEYYFLSGSTFLRDYRMYAKMAGVRNEGWLKEGEYFKPRGLFPYMSEWSITDLLKYPVDFKDIEHLPLILQDCSGENICTVEQKNDWIKRGISQKFGEYHITDPDYHSYSWLTGKEYHECLVDVVKRIDESDNLDNKSHPSVSWFALDAAIQKLEEKYETVVIFAFNN